MKKDNPKNLWNKSAEAWVDFVRTGKDYDREELNNPAMFKMLGNIKGKKILDLACGDGYNTRIIARKWAKVIGTDFSKELIDFAIEQEEKDKLGIAYYVSDASNLSIFKNNAFDIVTCFMALQDIENYQKAFKEVYRVLKNSGRFVFVIPHPCFTRRIIDGKTIGGWEYKKGTKKLSSENALYYKVDEYFNTNNYIVQWNMNRLTKHFKSMAFHRTLTDYFNALAKAGFLISRLIEPKPTKEGPAKYPDFFQKSLRIPSSIVIDVVKCE
jgi:ubiquinone/menaquinone biosynthesis C-methylase UbiE